MSELLAAALGYAQRGWQVFPCKPLGKQPATPHGFKDATTDAAQIRRWWAAMPSANIGLRTGAASGVFVIDIDVKGGVPGYDHWLALCKAHDWRSTPHVLAAGTPSGGMHSYFAQVEGIGIARGSLPAGIDVRGDGGYVLLPPSDVDAPTTRIINGARLPYSWLYPDATAIMSAPAWLVDMLRSKTAQPIIERRAQVQIEPKDALPANAAAIEGVLRVLAEAGEGERNNRLLWCACRLFDHGLASAQVEAHLLPLAAQVGLPEREAVKTIGSAEKQERRPTDQPDYAPQERKPASFQRRNQARLRRLGVK